MSDPTGGGTPPLPGWSFSAIGIPVPQGSKVGSKWGVRDANATVLKPWRETIKREALGAGPKLDGPVRTLVVFTRAKPKSAPKRKPYQPAVFPDVDKELRAVFDSITGAGLWVDDGRVVDVRARDVAVGESVDALPVPGVVVAACVSVTVDGSPEEDMRLTGLYADALSAVWAAYRSTPTEEVCRA